MNRNILSAFFILITLTTVAQKQITVEDIYKKGVFRQASVRGINWMNDGRYYSAQVGNDIVKYDVTTGQIVETIVKGSDLNPSISFRRYSFSANERKVLLTTERESIYRRSYKAEFYVYNLDNKTLTKLSPNGKQSYASFSPDGSKVAFARDNNLFYVNLADMKETQITSDGVFNKIINGSTDWVTEEELSFTKAFEWSGDGSTILYLTFDESGVKEYNLQKWNKGQLYPEDYKFKYPKAGEDNATIKATVFKLKDGQKKVVDLKTSDEFYLARIRKAHDDKTFSLIKLNRLQNQMEIVHVDAQTAESKIILTEKNERYIDVDFVDDLIYLKDGKHFVISSERSGFKHLYLFDMAGKMVRQITNGDWEVTDLIGIDQSSRKAKVYFTSTEGSPMERYFFVTGIDGKRKTKLTAAQGVHRINMSNDFKYYIDNYSSSTTPLQVSLHQTKGNQLIKTLEDNKALQAKVKEYNLTPKEFFTYKTVDGTSLNGFMLKPVNFDATKKYPVLVYQYSGPGSQNVMNSWSGGHYYWHQMLTQKGYIVAVIDTRGTGGRGEAFKKITYEQLGKYEVEDHIEGGKYLAGLPFVDDARIGIWGWSYGGYMSSLALMKGAEVFNAAIAVAPVTNWRFYDTIYTERYMGKPQDNASGYDDNSPTSHVDKLKGNYLLIHGTGDDNVHFQNAVTLQNALIASEKQFDSFYYPDRAHSIARDAARPHLFEMMTNWVLENL